MQRRPTVWLPVAALVIAAIAVLPVLLHHRTVRPPAPSTPPAAHSPPPTPAASPSPSGQVVKAGDPDALVRLFFESLKKEDWRGAWACLSPACKKTLGYRAFVAGFKGSPVASYDFAARKIVGAGNFSLVVEVPYTLSGGSGPHIATLRCVNLTAGGPPDWKVQSLVMRPKP